MNQILSAHREILLHSERMLRPSTGCGRCLRFSTMRLFFSYHTGKFFLHRIYRMLSVSFRVSSGSLSSLILPARLRGKASRIIYGRHEGEHPIHGRDTADTVCRRLPMHNAFSFCSFSCSPLRHEEFLTLAP